MKKVFLIKITIASILFFDSSFATASTYSYPPIGPWTIPSKVYSSTPFNIVPPSSPSKGAWRYSISDSNIVTINENGIFNIIGVGTTTVTATQAAAGTYLSSSSTTSLIVTPATPKLGSFVLPTKSLGSSSIILTPPKSTSSGAWSYASSDTSVATVSGGVLNMIGVGTTVITATQSAYGNYLSSSSKTTFKVTPGVPILGTFSIPDQYLGNNGFTISPPTSTSSGDWLFTSANPSIASIDGSNVWLNSVGSTKITATQIKTTNWGEIKTNAILLVTKHASTTTDSFGSRNNLFTIDFTSIGNPNNPRDLNGRGSVPYYYSIGKYVISQNQVDSAVANGLVNVTSGPWTGDQPATRISWYQAAAFVNWLNASKGYPPAYNLQVSMDGTGNISLWPDQNYRNPNAHYFLPDENEWYKAAYYDPTQYNVRLQSLGVYWLYPTGSNIEPQSIFNGTYDGTAIYNLPSYQGPASVFLAGGQSPYGTIGQGGNVYQWIEENFNYTYNYNTSIQYKLVRGGAWSSYAGYLVSSYYNWRDINSTNYSSVGFRVVRIP
jgi:formylglycine-generating enzyme